MCLWGCFTGANLSVMRYFGQFTELVRITCSPQLAVVDWPNIKHIGYFTDPP